MTTSDIDSAAMAVVFALGIGAKTATMRLAVFVAILLLFRLVDLLFDHALDHLSWQ